MFDVYGNLPTSAIRDIFHSKRGRGGKRKKNSLLFCLSFLTPYPLYISFFFFFSSCLAAFPHPTQEEEDGRPAG